MAEKKKVKFDNYISPRGVFVYPKLNKADEYKGKRTYNVKLRLDANKPEDKAFIEKVQAKHEAGVEAARAELAERAKAEDSPKKKKTISEALAKLQPWKCPAQPVTLDDGTDSPNLFEVSFKMPAVKKDRKTGEESEQRPTLVDAKQNKLNPAKVSVWGGSEGKIGGFFMPGYADAACTAGVSMRMQAVQILKLVSGGGNVNFGEAEEGYTYSDDEAADESNPYANGAGDETPSSEEKSEPTSGVKF